MRWTVPLALFAALVALALLFAIRGRPLIDEGMFLTASELVYAGQRPYRDFPFLQGPVLPYLYGLAALAPGAPLLAGRLLSAAAFLGTALAGALLAARFGGAVAAACLLVLLGLDLPALYTCTTVRTQSASTALVVLSMWSLTRAPSRAVGFALAPSLLLWATGLRLTHGLAFAAVSVWVGLHLRRAPRTLLRVAALVAVQVALVFAPAFAAPRDAAFHLLTGQLARGERFGVRFESLEPMLRSKLLFAFAPPTNFFPVPWLALGVIVGLAAAAARGWRPDPRLPLSDARTAQLVLVAGALLAFAPHLLLERGHFEYFVPSAVLLSVAVAIALPAWASGSARRALLVALVAGALGTTAAVKAAREWGVWIGRGRTGLAGFAELGQSLAGTLGPGCTMATFQTHLAVAAGCRPLPGLEYSLFSFYPRLSDAQAEARGVLNHALLHRRIEALRPEAIAVTRAYRARFWGGAPAPRRGPGTLDFLPSARDAYAFQRVLRIPSGPRLPLLPDTVAVDLFVRRDLVPPD